jgi:hypothetical protein
MNAKKAFSGASLAAAVAVTLAGCSNPPEPKMADAASGKISCKEANTCKTKGSCGGVAMGEKHSCKGQNACGGNVREITKAECDAIKGTVASN